MSTGRITGAGVYCQRSADFSPLPLDSTTVKRTEVRAPGTLRSAGRRPERTGVGAPASWSAAVPSAPCTRFQSQRDCVCQPRVARNELPWVSPVRSINPEGVEASPSLGTNSGCNPLGVDPDGTFSQGSSDEQFMSSGRESRLANRVREPARDRLGRSGSPAESPFEFAKSACERHAAGGTPALRFMESGITVGNGAPNSYARPLAKTT